MSSGLTREPINAQRLSLFSCAATFAMSPIILLFDTSATTLGAKASIAFTLCSFGIFTTGTPLGPLAFSILVVRISQE